MTLPRPWLSSILAAATATLAGLLLISTPDGDSLTAAGLWASSMPLPESLTRAAPCLISTLSAASVTVDEPWISSIFLSFERSLAWTGSLISSIFSPVSRTIAWSLLVNSICSALSLAVVLSLLLSWMPSAFISIFSGFGTTGSATSRLRPFWSPRLLMVNVIPSVLKTLTSGAAGWAGTSFSPQKQPLQMG